MNASAWTIDNRPENVLMGRPRDAYKNCEGKSVIDESVYIYNIQQRCGKGEGGVRC